MNNNEIHDSQLEKRGGTLKSSLDWCNILINKKDLDFLPLLFFGFITSDYPIHIFRI